MKYHYIYLLAALLMGCGSDKPNVVFDSIKVDRTVNLTKDQDSPQCHVVLEVLQNQQATSEVGRMMNKAIVSKIFDMQDISVQAAADSFANSYTRDYVKNMLPLYREDRSDKEKHPWYEYRYSIGTETVDGREGTTPYMIRLEYYEGGAHSISQQLTLNFDNVTGHVLNLSDIMVPGYESRLNELLLQALMKHTETKSVEELRQRGYLYSMDLFVPENFILAEDELTFIYNPYEIAPYSEGLIEIKISYDDLKDLLKK
jgi:hypothetical protein